MVLSLLFYFLPFFWAWDIYCFLNVKNFKYRKHADKGNKHVCMYYFCHLKKSLLIINTMRGGKNQCHFTKQKDWKKQGPPLVEQDTKPVYSNWRKCPVEGARASFGTSFWLESGHLGDD